MQIPQIAKAISERLLFPSLFPELSRASEPSYRAGIV